MGAAGIRLRADNDRVTRSHECCAWGSVLIRKNVQHHLIITKKCCFLAKKRNFWLSIKLVLLNNQPNKKPIAFFRKRMYICIWVVTSVTAFFGLVPTNCDLFPWLERFLPSIGRREKCPKETKIFRLCRTRQSQSLCELTSRIIRSHKRLICKTLIIRRYA